MFVERRISIVEDDESLRLALVGLVRSLGHAADGYESAEHFLESPNPALSDCVITDIQMPGLSGIDLKLALVSVGIDTPVIMITARTEPALHDRAIASGAICLLRKPFEPDTLIGCLEKALAS